MWICSHSKCTWGWSCRRSDTKVEPRRSATRGFSRVAARYATRASGHNLCSRIEPLRLYKKSSITLEGKFAKGSTSSLRCHRQVASQVSGCVCHRASEPHHQPDTSPSVLISLWVWATGSIDSATFKSVDMFAPARIASLSPHCSRDHQPISWDSMRCTTPRDQERQKNRATKLGYCNRRPRTQLSRKEHEHFQQQNMNMSSGRACTCPTQERSTRISVLFVDAVPSVTVVVPITVVQSCNLFTVPPFGRRVPLTVTWRVSRITSYTTTVADRWSTRVEWWSPIQYTTLRKSCTRRMFVVAMHEVSGREIREVRRNKLAEKWFSPAITASVIFFFDMNFVHCRPLFS